MSARNRRTVGVDRVLKEHPPIESVPIRVCSVHVSQHTLTRRRLSPALLSSLWRRLGIGHFGAFAVSVGYSILATLGCHDGLPPLACCGLNHLPDGGPLLWHGCRAPTTPSIPCVSYSTTDRSRNSPHALRPTHTPVSPSQPRDAYVHPSMAKATGTSIQFSVAMLAFGDGRSNDSIRVLDQRTGVLGIPEGRPVFFTPLVRRGVRFLIARWRL
jgi:hypothetical protein